MGILHFLGVGFNFVICSMVLLLGFDGWEKRFHQILACKNLRMLEINKQQQLVLLNAPTAF
jgi:hypothetical protein